MPTDVIRRSIRRVGRQMLSRSMIHDHLHPVTLVARWHLAADGYRDKQPNVTPLDGICSPLDTSRYLAVRPKCAKFKKGTSQSLMLLVVSVMHDRSTQADNTLEV